MTKSKSNNNAKLKTLGHWLGTVAAFDGIELNKINFKKKNDQNAHKVLAVAYLIMYLTCEPPIGCQKKKWSNQGSLKNIHLNMGPLTQCSLIYPSSKHCFPHFKTTYQHNLCYYNDTLNKYFGNQRIQPGDVSTFSVTPVDIV